MKTLGSKWPQMATKGRTSASVYQVRIVGETELVDCIGSEEGAVLN